MAVTNTYAGDNTEPLDGIFKRVYGKFVDLLPQGFKAQKDFAFEDALGDTFNEAVLLAHEAGFTYAPSSSDAYQLNAAVTGQTRPAQVNGSNISLRSRIGIQALHRAARAGEKAFKRALDVVVDNMKISTHKRLEADIWYGRCSIGEVASESEAFETITLTAASFAPGFWAGMEGATVSITAALDDDGYSSAQRQSSVTTPITISAVNLDTRTITLSTNLTGGTGIVAGDLVWFGGQLASVDGDSGDANCAPGIRRIFDASSYSENIYNIAPASYSLWNPSTYSVGGRLTFEKVSKAIYLPTSKGLDEELCLYINPNVWADLLNDEVALRRHNEKKAQYKVGGEGIEFYSQNGTIMIKPSIYIKEGEGFLLPKRYWRRVGASDITFTRPTQNGGVFLWVQDFEAYELRIYSNQAPYSNKPGLSTLLSGIVAA